MKKILVLVMLCLFVIACVAGCSQKGADDMSTPDEPANTADTPEGEKTEPVTVKYYTWSDEETYAKIIVDTFNAIDPNVQVDLNVIPSLDDEYENKIKVLLAGREEIDVLGMRREQQMLQYADLGALADISSLITDFNLDISKYGPAFTKLEQDGQYFGLPYRNSCWFLIYNKDIFDAQGIDYPGQLTWDEYRELANQLTSGEGADKIYGGYMVSWVLDIAAIQQGATILDDDPTTSWEAVTLLKTLYEDPSHMSLAELTATNSDWMAEFERGSVAMMPNGDWFIGMILADEEAGKSDVNWDLAPLPVPEGVEDGTTFGHYTLVSMTEYCEHQDEAFSFMKYLAGEEGAKILAQKGMFPAYNTPEIEESYITASGKDSTNVLFQSIVLPETPVHTLYAQVADAFREEAELYIHGEKTLEDAQGDFLDRRADILAGN